MENVLKSNANANVINSRGWELSVLNIISIRQGRQKDPGGKVFYDTSGFGISFINVPATLEDDEEKIRERLKGYI